MNHTGVPVRVRVAFQRHFPCVPIHSLFCIFLSLSLWIDITPRRERKQCVCVSFQVVSFGDSQTTTTRTRPSLFYFSLFLRQILQTMSSCVSSIPSFHPSPSPFGVALPTSTKDTPPPPLAASSMGAACFGPVCRFFSVCRWFLPWLVVCTVDIGSRPPVVHTTSDP